jgi:hypothetical protein
MYVETRSNLDSILMPRLQASLRQSSKDFSKSQNVCSNSKQLSLTE